MEERYRIEATRTIGRWMVIEDVGWGEIELFAGTHDECVAFIRDLEGEVQ